MAQAFRSTRVVTTDGVNPATLVIEGERIVGVHGWNEMPAGAALRDFGDRIILPGLVDSHVHINEPGRTEWEGFATATRAAASGGVTTLVDMPLNCIPEIVSVAALEAKRTAAQDKAWIDWAAWGGVVRGNSPALKPMIDAGVAGFKCFLVHSGIDGFQWVEESDLRIALQQLRDTGLPLLAHAEVSSPILAATSALVGAGADWVKYSTYLKSRPHEAEIEAISLLIRLAEEYQTAIHIVHLSTARALPMLAEARRRGVPITVETCVQYLWFASEDIPDGATEYKCAPPIRDSANRDALWEGLREGVIDLIATDHSPCPPAMKQRESGRWDLAWGGISGLGLALPVMWTAMVQRGMETNEGIHRLCRWMASEPARLAGLSGTKGTLTQGADADFVVFDPDAEWLVTEDNLHFRHKVSPYLGTRLKGRVLETWLRGEVVFSSEGFTAQARGRELRHR